MLPSNPVIKPLARELIQLANDLLNETKSLPDLAGWLLAYSDKVRPYLCDSAEHAMLERFHGLMHQPVNIFAWRLFIKQLETGSVRRSCP